LKAVKNLEDYFYH